MSGQEDANAGGGSKVLRAIVDFLRRHVVAALVSAAGIGATGSAAVVRNLYEAQVNRVEEMKVAEFQALASERNRFLELLSGFTEEIALDGAVDPKKKTELSASLVSLYNGYRAFTVNISKDKEQPIRELQTSLNELRKRVQLTSVKQDLDPLAVAFKKVATDLRIVQPIIEEAVGKPSALPSSG